ADGGQRALEGVRGDVVEDRAEAARGGGVGDAPAHDAGADDGDGVDGHAAPCEAPIIPKPIRAAAILRRALRYGAVRGRMATPVFDGLTIVEEAVDAAGWRARLHVAITSRAFAGHFEGQPILPGVAFLV